MTIRYTLSELPKVASELIKVLKSPIWLFYGEMGSGKTTLIREILHQLDVKDNIQSPTFSLVNEYLGQEDKTIYHFDFYRIENEEEAYDIGIEDYFYSDNLCLIEWPEKIPNLLPDNSVEIHIIVVDNQTRSLTINI